MLPKYYRLRILNSTDQILDHNSDARVAIRMSPWKLTTGALVYGTTIVDDLDFIHDEVIGIGASREGPVHDNTANLYLGINGFFEIIAPLNSTDGLIYLYLEESDDNSNWPSDAADFDITKHMILIAALALSTDALDEDASMNFVIE